MTAFDILYPLPDPQPDCPHEDGPFHFWTCDGAFTVSCDNCGADGRITVTEEGSVDEEDQGDTVTP